MLAAAIAGCDESGGGGDGGSCPNGIFEGDVTVASQGDFALLEGYTDVGGILQISCEDCGAIEHLECMEMVYNRVLFVYNDAMTDLSGMETFRETNESVQIGPNDSLTSLDGLSGLEYIGGPLFISNNPQLSSLAGMVSLTGVNGFIQVTDNPQLGYCEVCNLVDQVGGEYSTTVAYNNKVDSCWDTETASLWCY